jgi:holo-[acyl-carrier protein] synthase
VNWRDIEITGGGKPEVILHGKAKDLASKSKIDNVHISLSHEKNAAIAFAISEVSN